MQCLSGENCKSIVINEKSSMNVFGAIRKLMTEYQEVLKLAMKHRLDQ